MRKIKQHYIESCPVCGYIVDNRVTQQYYCDRYGQKFGN